MARNALVNQRWDFEVPSINNLLQPIQGGIDRYNRQAQQAEENRRADEQLGMQREKLGMAKASAARADDAARVAKLGREATAIMGLQGPQRQSAWQQWISSNPDVAEHARRTGVDLSDAINGPQFIATQAGLYNPTEEKERAARLGLIQAQTRAAGYRAEPEIVRTMRAGGIDPSSPEGQQIIRNSIRGGSPIDQAVAQAIQGSLAPTAPPPAEGQPRLQQQSMEGAGDQPQIIQAQASVPAAPQGQQSESMVDTPLGRMPESRAKVLGFALAMQGKGEAGKMMAGEPGLGKEATNDIDKKFANASEQFARLRSISQAFRPEFQTIGTRLNMMGAGWMAKLDPKNVDPQTRKDLVEFSTFRRRSFENINRLINELSGAATSVQEADRIKMQVPDAGQGIFDGDDPVSFKAKLDDVTKSTTLAMARYAWMRRNNPTLLRELATRNMAGIENVMPLERMGGVMNERRNQIYQELKQRSPNATREQLLPFVGQQLKQEFGI